MDWKDIFIVPFKSASVVVQTVGRIATGITGVVMITAGLLLIEPFGFHLMGIPLVLLGLLAVIRSIF